MSNTAASVLITRCLDNLSRLSTTTTRSGATMESKALDWLNLTTQEMSNQHSFQEMWKLYNSSVVANSKTYAFPSTWKEIIEFRVIDGTNSRKLTQMPPQTFYRLVPYPEGESSGTPNCYVPFGATFDLYPIPDQAYIVYIRLVAAPTVIVTTTDLIDYNNDKDDLIVDGMTMRGFRFLQMHEDAAFYQKEYMRLMKEAVMADAYPPDWSPVGMGFSSTSKVSLGNYWNKIDVFRSP